MLSIVKSMSLLGLDGCLIYVQVDVSMGIPGWDIVGLPDTSVKEAKERVRTAIKNSGYELQSRKIIVITSNKAANKLKNIDSSLIKLLNIGKTLELKYN